jgi:hypothetical protein
MLKVRTTLAKEREMKEAEKHVCPRCLGLVRS